MSAPNLPQQETCIFCTADPQGTHKRFDKIERAKNIKCEIAGHDVFTCTRCTSNHHNVDKATLELGAPSLPRIILTSPDSEKTCVLEPFFPNKKRLYPPPKRRGRAIWPTYNWMPEVSELLNERRVQLTRARNRLLREGGEKYRGVQLLAASVLTSIPISFFGSKSKGTEESDDHAAMTQVTVEADASASSSQWSSLTNIAHEGERTQSSSTAKPNHHEQSAAFSYPKIRSMLHISFGATPTPAQDLHIR